MDSAAVHSAAMDEHAMDVFEAVELANFVPLVSGEAG